jgi:hypothetical protein
VVDDVGKNIYLYVNGEPSSPVPYTGSLKDYGTVDYYIGASESSGIWNQSINGTIDEVRIWNRTLTADEVKELYQSSTIYSTLTNFSFNESNSDDSDVYYEQYGTLTKAKTTTLLTKLETTKRDY